MSGGAEAEKEKAAEKAAEKVAEKAAEKVAEKVAAEKAAEKVAEKVAAENERPRRRRRWPLRGRLRALGSDRLLRVSAVLTLIALALMAWSMLQPTPLPVMLAMSVGQAIGTLAFSLYGYVVVADLRRARRARREGEGANASPPSERPEPGQGAAP
jgi:cation transport ATPase